MKQNRTGRAAGGLAAAKPANFDEMMTNIRRNVSSSKYYRPQEVKKSNTSTETLIELVKKATR